MKSIIPIPYYRYNLLLYNMYNNSFTIILPETLSPSLIIVNIKIISERPIIFTLL